jgi:hypothetical protein
MLPSSLSSPQDSNRYTPRSLDDPYVIDMIKLADERIARLQSDYDMSKQTVELLETKLSNYKNQVKFYFKKKFKSKGSNSPISIIIKLSINIFITRLKYKYFFSSTLSL